MTPSEGTTPTHTHSPGDEEHAVPARSAERGIRALLWDIDGTLIDTTDLIVAALDHTYRTFLGRTMPADRIRAIIGMPLREQVLALGNPAECGADPATMESEFVRFYEAHRERERLVEPALHALRACKEAGALTALVTSKNLAEIANTLPRLDVLSWVDTVVSADDVARPKPDPESVTMALDRLRVAPGEALLIGDTVHDMRAGRAAGVLRCAVTWGAGSRQLLVAERPEWICNDPDELLGLLRKALPSPA